MRAKNFVGGLFGDSAEEKKWLAEINSKGWTDEKGEPDKFRKWCENNPLEPISSDGKYFVWDKSWFNPLEYVNAPGEHDSRRLVLSILLLFSHERPAMELHKLMADNLFINPLSVREAIIDYWRNTEIVVEGGNGYLQAGPKLLKHLGNIEDIIMGSQRPIPVETVLEVFGDSSAPIPEKKGRIVKHGVIVDMEALELNENWLYERMRETGPVIEMIGLAKLPPLQLDAIDGISLSNEQILDILRLVCVRLAEIFPEAEIEHDQTIMRVGNTKEVAEAFIRKLEGIKESVSAAINEKKNLMDYLNNIRRKEEQVRTRQRLESRNTDSDERKLAIKGAILSKLETKLMDEEI